MKNTALVAGALLAGLVLGGSAIAMALPNSTSADFCVKQNGQISLAVDGGCRVSEELLTITGDQGPVGPPGSEGPQGPQGEPGADGRDGGISKDDLVLVVDEETVQESDENGLIHLFAICPSDMFAIGGGVEQSNHQFVMVGFGLSSGGHGFQAAWSIPNNSFVPDRGDEVRAVAYCLPDAGSN